MSLARARDDIDHAIDACARSREHALELVARVARVDRGARGDARANANESRERDAIAKALQLGSRLARERDAKHAIAVKSFDDNEVAGARATRDASSSSSDADARRASLAVALRSNARSLEVDVESVRTNDSESDVVIARAPGVFEASWVVGDVARASVRAYGGGSSLAHDAFTDRARERGREIQSEQSHDDVVAMSLAMVAWLEARVDAFTAPDWANDGRVLAADVTRGNALIPSRLLPGR